MTLAEKDEKTMSQIHRLYFILKSEFTYYCKTENDGSVSKMKNFECDIQGFIHWYSNGKAMSVVLGV